MTQKTIAQYAAEAKSDQLNASDLTGSPKTIKITKITAGSDEQRMVIHYEGGEGKPYKPCRSMVRFLNHFWGDDEQQWIGRRMTLVCDPEVIFGKEKVGGIRISELSDVAKDKSLTVMLRVGKMKMKEFVVGLIKPHPVKIQTITASPTPPSPKQEIDLAALTASGEFAANNGIEAYKEFFGRLSAAEKTALKDKHPELKALAEKVTIPATEPQPADPVAEEAPI